MPRGGGQQDGKQAGVYDNLQRRLDFLLQGRDLSTPQNGLKGGNKGSGSKEELDRFAVHFNYIGSSSAGE